MDDAPYPWRQLFSGRSFWVMVALWSTILLASLGWDVFFSSDLIQRMAIEQARATLRRDLHYRRWNAAHGGGYVPVTATTQPNPLLTVPNRDVTTTAGQQLTLINPAFMIRQLNEMVDADDGLKTHLTSLRPLRRENAADAWETAALRTFAEGGKESLELTSIDGKPYLRLMRPLIAEASCLTCHGAQGYQLGDVRGGLSIALPLAPLHDIIRVELIHHLLIYGVVWLLGLAGILGLHRHIALLGRRHQQSERVRIEQHAFVQHILDTIPLPIFSKDEEGRFRHVNAAFLAFHGLPPDQVLGHTVFDIAPRDLATIYHAQDQELRTSGGTQVYRAEACGLDGRRRPFEYIKALYLRDGKPAGLVGLMRDLSESIRTERVLQESKERFRRLFDLNIAGVALHDIICDGGGQPVDFRCVDLNSAFERLTGLKREDVVGRTVLEYMPGSKPEMIARYGRVALTGTADCFEHFATALGRWYEISAFQTQPGQFAVMFHDISARKGIEEALRRAHAETKEAMLTKSRFLSTMSHEIRTPLNGIIGLTSLLRRSPLSTDQQEMIDLVQMSGQNLLSLINDILDLAKLDAGHMELESIPIPLDQLIGDLHGTFDVALMAKSVSFRVEVDAALGGRIIGDPLRLRQILANLMGNAVKFTERGGVTLILRREFDLQGHRQVIIEIHDTGIGIPAEYLPHLFEPFTQADLSSTRRFGGSGLGLTVVKRLMDLMGGEINVASTSAGTRIRLVIPQQGLPGDEGERTDEVLSEEPVTAIHKGPAPRVLVVEDDPTNMTMTRMMLEEMGICCHIAMDGDQAMTVIETKHMDAVLMDCRLPGRDGYETTREIRAREKARGGTDHVVIIAITGSIQPEDQQRSLEAGMDAVLAKPFTFEALRSCLATWLNRRGKTTPPS